MDLKLFIVGLLSIAFLGRAWGVDGDINRDGTVNFSDFVILAQNYGKSGEPADLDTTTVTVYDTLRITVYDTVLVTGVGDSGSVGSIPGLAAIAVRSIEKTNFDADPEDDGWQVKINLLDNVGDNLFVDEEVAVEVRYNIKIPFAILTGVQDHYIYGQVGIYEDHTRTFGGQTNVVVQTFSSPTFVIPEEVYFEMVVRIAEEFDTPYVNPNSQQADDHWKAFEETGEFKHILRTGKVGAGIGLIKTERLEFSISVVSGTTSIEAPSVEAYEFKWSRAPDSE